MFIDKQHVMLEAGVQMWFEAKLNDDGVMMAIDMSIDAIEAFEDVAKESGKCLREGYADPAGKHLLVVDVALDPGHEVLYVFGCWHLGGLLVVLIILPQILEPRLCQCNVYDIVSDTYSSVAFISGQVCGEQNSVIDP